MTYFRKNRINNGCLNHRSVFFQRMGIAARSAFSLNSMLGHRFRYPRSSRLAAWSNRIYTGPQVFLCRHIVLAFLQ